MSTNNKLPMSENRNLLIKKIKELLINKNYEIINVWRDYNGDCSEDDNIDTKTITITMSKLYNNDFMYILYDNVYIYDSNGDDLFECEFNNTHGVDQIVQIINEKV